VFPLLRMCVLGVVLLLTIISTAWAADQTVTLRLGAGSALTLERPFKTVLVGDPNIVNVHTHSDRLVILEPLHPGETNLVFVDEQSITIANIRIVVSGASAVLINYRDRIAFSFRSNSDIRKREDDLPLRSKLVRKLNRPNPKVITETAFAKIGILS
jgi:Flp pilus assembly secretin CpaC